MQKIKPKSNKTRSENDILIIFLKIQLIDALIYISVFLLSSVLSLVTDVSQKYDTIITLIAFALSSFISGFYAGKKKRQNGLLAGVIYTLPLNALVLIISAIISDFKVDYLIAVSAVVLVLSAGLGGILSVNMRHRR